MNKLMKKPVDLSTERKIQVDNLNFISNIEIVKKVLEI